MTNQELINRKKEIAKETDLVDLISFLGYHPKVVGRNYTVTEMDSIRIYNRKTWCRFSTRFSTEPQGGDAINWLREFHGMNFNEALDYLVDYNGYHLDKDALLNTSIKRPMHIQAEKIKEQKREPFVLPPAARYQTWMFNYLRKRGISDQTIRMFFEKKLIYLCDKRYNVVFVSYDSNGVARHAFQRGINSDFKGDVAGNDKNYGFNLPRKSDTIVVSEGAIDIMSYYDITHDSTSSLLALGMVCDHPLVKYLEEYPGIKHIKLLLDSDQKGNEATESLLSKYQSEEWADKGITIEDIRYPRMSSIQCKDTNELLQYMNKHPGEIKEPYPYPFQKKAGLKVEKTADASKKEESDQAVQETESPKECKEEPFRQKPKNSEELGDLLLASLSQAYERMFSLNGQRGGEEVDDCEIYQAMGAAHALYAVCEQAGLKPPLPGQEKKREKKLKGKALV